jgi:hypothetical protein
MSARTFTGRYSVAGWLPTVAAGTSWANETLAEWPRRVRSTSHASTLHAARRSHHTRAQIRNIVILTVFLTTDVDELITWFRMRRMLLRARASGATVECGRGCRGTV